jgi:hypothetical protein
MLWRKLLKRAFLLNEKHKGELKLRRPLGPWVGFTSHMEWKYNVGVDYLYVRIGSNCVGICDPVVARYATRSRQCHPPSSNKPPTNLRVKRLHELSHVARCLAMLTPTNNS